MSDFNNNTAAPLADWEKELIMGADPAARIQELSEALGQTQSKLSRLDTDFVHLRAANRDLRNNLQESLADWAQSYLQAGDDDYKALSELMVDNGLEGLKRTFNVTVRVTYEFEVEVEATDEDSARDDVDNDIQTHVNDHVSLWDLPDYSEIEVEEA